VAQRFNSTVLPRQSDSFFGLPCASSKVRSGSRKGAEAMVSAANSPWASGAIFFATSTAAVQAVSPAGRFSPPKP
jgi:hypothetical protein